MPRVATKTKSKAGKPYDCSRCAEPIKAGDKYYEWSFYRSSPTRQHESHGYPKPSQLTQSKLSGAYAAIEDAEETISTADNAADMAQALTTAAEEVCTVKDEYQESLDNMGDNLAQGSTGQEIQEKIDALEEFEGTLNDAASEIESGETPEEGTSAEDHLEALRQQASDALGEFSL